MPLRFKRWAALAGLALLVSSCHLNTKAWQQLLEPSTTTITTPTTTTTVLARTVHPAPIVRPLARSVAAVAITCGVVISEVEAQGLYPAPGFTVLCPGYALGHEGMTCVNEPGACPGASVIAIHLVAAFVVANEFENSRIVSGLPTRCSTIDCGGRAYGY